MRETTLCYIERDGFYLMLHRNKKQKDPNEGKWIGVGGKLEVGETVEEGLLREIYEETGWSVTSYEKRGVIDFISDTWEDEKMHLFVAQTTQTQVPECNEGTLAWVRKEDVMNLNLWEGDRIFLKKLIDGEKDFHLRLEYTGETLTGRFDLD